MSVRPELITRTSTKIRCALDSGQIVLDVICAECRFAPGHAFLEQILVHSSFSFIPQKTNQQVGDNLGHFGQDRMLLLRNDRQLRALDPLVDQAGHSRV